MLEDQYAAIEQAVDLFLSGARRLVAAPDGELRDSSIAQRKLAGR